MTAENSGAYNAVQEVREDVVDVETSKPLKASKEGRGSRIRGERRDFRGLWAEETRVSISVLRMPLHCDDGC